MSSKFHRILTITDCFEETSGRIPILTKSKCLVKYRGTVSAGFNVADTEIEENVDSIFITIPHCTIQEDSVNVRGDDIYTYNTNFSITKPDRNTTLKLVSLAEKRAL